MRHLVLMMLFLANNALAEVAAFEADKAWARTIAKSSQEAMLQAMQEKLQELKAGQYKELFEEVLRPKPYVLIFVSESVPLHALKILNQDAKKYNGVLVWKGLPEKDGKPSFKKWMAMAMNVDKEGARFSLDPESCEKFGVKAVPTIVFVKEEDCMTTEGCKVTYDKIAGNIRVRLALEEFAKSGDLAGEARELLQ